MARRPASASSGQLRQSLDDWHDPSRAIAPAPALACPLGPRPSPDGLNTALGRPNPVIASSCLPLPSKPSRTRGVSRHNLGPLPRYPATELPCCSFAPSLSRSHPPRPVAHHDQRHHSSTISNFDFDLNSNTIKFVYTVNIFRDTNNTRTRSTSQLELVAYSSSCSITFGAAG